MVQPRTFVFEFRVTNEREGDYWRVSNTRGSACYGTRCVLAIRSPSIRPVESVIWPVRRICSDLFRGREGRVHAVPMPKGFVDTIDSNDFTRISGNTTTLTVTTTMSLFGAEER